MHKNACDRSNYLAGKLEHFDLKGNIIREQEVDLSELAEFQTSGFSILERSSSPALNEPYDDDP
ncbi:hypothetical protein RDI58_024139 [Solanum bulbocastanum]|uniref:Uncharacterized protein n=1 Tax=Solanum bulbocastanum TaxID=147425 RepID=A0AAN8T2G2_SOLBU